MTTDAEELDRKMRQAIAILAVLRNVARFNGAPMSTTAIGECAAVHLGLDYNTVEGRSHPLSLWNSARTLYVLKWLAEHGDVECVKTGGARSLAWRHAHPERSPFTGDPDRVT